MSAHPAPRATRSIRAETAGSSGLALGPNQRGKAGGEAEASISDMGLFSLVTLVAHEHYHHQTTHLSAVPSYCLVYENHADLQRCVGAGSSPFVDPDDFSDITRIF